MQREANDRLTLIVSGFDATVGRFRYLSAVLSPADPIRELHRNPGDAATITAANRYLQSLNQNLIVSGYTAINAVVKAELFPISVRATGVGCIAVSLLVYLTMQDTSMRSAVDRYRAPPAVQAGGGYLSRLAPPFPQCTSIAGLDWLC